MMMFRENTSTSSLNSQMAFYTTGSGTHAERIRIDSSGFVGIGGTPTHQLHLTSTVPTIKLTVSDVSTNAFIQSSGGNLNFFADDGNSRASTTMGFFADGTAVSYTHLTLPTIYSV